MTRQTLSSRAIHSAKQTPIDAAILTTERISERLQAILDRLPVDLPLAQQATWFGSNSEQAVTK